MNTKATPANVGSMERLGGLFTAAMLKQATMTELAEARAKQGYCPECQGPRLRYINRGAGMVFKQCADCGAIAVLKDA